MTALSQDVADGLTARIAELEHQLQSSAADNARLQGELSLARERQQASAEVLGAIADTSGDDERALRQIAETSARLFGASSVTLRITGGDPWSRTIAVGPGAERIVSQVKSSELKIGGKNFPGTVVAENRQIHLPDIFNVGQPYADFPGLIHGRAAGARVMAGTPLRRDGEAIGALILQRDRPEPFSSDELGLLQSFADQAVIAIENARLFNETKEALDRQTATADILKVIASSPSDVQPVFEAIATNSKQLIGGFSTAVFRFVDGIVHLAAYTPISPVADEVLKSSFPRPLGELPFFDLVKGSEVVEEADTETNADVHLRDLARARGFRSTLLAPLMSKETRIGLIVVTRKAPGSFAKHHVQLLRTFADQAVIAIENVRLFDEVQARTADLSESLQQQTATADVLKVISRSAFDLQAVLETLIRSAVELSAARRGAIFLREGDEFRYQAASDADLHPDWIRFLKDNPQKAGRHSAIARAIRSGHIVCVPDVLADPEITMPATPLAGIRAVLAVPLLRDGQVEGIMALSRQVPGPFTERQIDLVQTFADQAVIAVENARLLRELRRRTDDLSEALRQQTATSEVLQVISSSPGELEPVFRTMLTNAMALCEASHGVVWLREGDGFRSVALHGPWPEGFVEQWRSGTLVRPGPDAPITRAAVTGKAVQTPDLGESPAYHAGDPLPVAAVDVAGIRTVLSVPMFRDAECVGAIALSRREVRLFSDKQIELVGNFAKQAVIAIENARLLRELRRRTDDLSESLEQQTATSDVLQVISNSSGDLQPVFDAMLANATRICEAKFGMMWLIEGDAARCVALHNAPPAFAELRRHEPVIHPGPDTAMGRLLRTRQVVHVEDAMAERAYIEGDPVRRANADLAGARTIVAVPLLRDNEVIGAIGIFHQEVRPFTDKQIQLVTNFANQAVIAIENARLLNELRHRTAELSRSLEELRAAQDRLVQTEKLASLGQLTAGIAHEIKNPLNFVNNFAALSAELTDELNDVLASASVTEKIRDEVDELTGLLKDNLQKIVLHGQRADSIVKNMLLHSREGSGEHRPTDVNALVEESLNLAYHGARAEKPQFNVTLQRELDPAAGTAELFPQEITRVLLNLISNGFYAVAKRGTESGEGFEPVLSAATRDRGAHVEIRIRDNGTGIPPEVRERMFNPFFTTKPAGQGTGLGLSMSHDIVVKQHGGTIEVDTAPDQFTEFTILLPRKSIFQTKNRGQP